FPYLVPDESRIQIDRWMIGTASDLQPLGATFENWDPTVDVQVSLEACVETGGILSDCRLPEDASLSMVGTWFSAGTAQRGSGEPIRLDSSANTQTVRIHVCAPGALVSDSVTFTAAIILGSRCRRISPIHA